MVCIQKHSLGSFLGDMKGNLGRPHFFPWGQFARHSKKNLSSQRASTNWPDIQLNWYAVESNMQQDKLGIPSCAISNAHGCHEVRWGEPGAMKERWMIWQCTCCCNDWQPIGPIRWEERRGNRRAAGDEKACLAANINMNQEEEKVRTRAGSCSTWRLLCCEKKVKLCDIKRRKKFLSLFPEQPSNTTLFLSSTWQLIIQPNINLCHKLITRVQAESRIYWCLNSFLPHCCACYYMYYQFTAPGD